MAKKYQSGSKLFLWRFKKLCIVFGFFLRKHLFASVVSIVLLMIMASIGIGIYALFSSPRFQVTEVRVSSDEFANVYEQQLWNFLVKDFQWTNVVSSLWYRMRFLPYYKNKYHRIERIESTRKGNILHIHIYGKQPVLIYRVVDSYYAQLLDKDRSVYKVKKEWLVFMQTWTYQTWSVESGDSISSIPVLELLISDSLLQHWFDPLFYSLSADALVKQVQIIHNTLNDYSSIQYIPWWQKLILVTKNKAYIYFDLRKNIYEQLRKYSLLWWSWVILKWKIDLGTMDNMIFIWK